MFSPKDPVVNQLVFFNADTVQAAAGHSIVQYSWNFGDNSADSTASGFQATHKFTQAGTFTVVLSVLDDAGQKSVLPTPVTIGTGLPVAQLSLTKTGGNGILADGSTSTAAPGFIIVTYRFVWNDGTADDTGSSPSASHTFATAGPHTVTLFVTDNATPVAHTSSQSQTITVP